MGGAAAVAWSVVDVRFTYHSATEGVQPENRLFTWGEISAVLIP